MTNTISNSDDVIDSRDVIARIEELNEELNAALDAVGDDNEARSAARTAWLETDGDELRALTDLAEEASGYASDWQYGETLIRDSYFKDYAMQLADDLGVAAPTAWPYTCIDWDQAARELQMDYTAVEFDGVTYWIR